MLFARLQDGNAWLLALLFTSFSVGGPFLAIEGSLRAGLRGPALFWKRVFNGLAGPLFYWFFAVFPARSPLDRALPALKHVLFWGTAAVAVPLGVGTVVGFTPCLALSAAAATLEREVYRFPFWVG